MTRRFNIAGPCEPDRHYMIPAARRLPEGPDLVEQGAYFVVHAPRQTGKTTAVRALARTLAASGKYAAVYLSCEGGSIAGDDYEAVQRSILDSARSAAERQLPAELQPPDPWPAAVPEGLLSRGLEAWSTGCPLPVVLVLDEIDSLRGKGLVSVLRQLRAGFPERPRYFPWSVVLCGMRDVRDYKMASGGDPDRTWGPSPFNVKVKSLRLDNLSAAEVAEMYAQHTGDTGQPFAPGAVDRVMEISSGQPWLVNALAREVIEEMGVSPPTPITPEHIEAARERLVLARATHLDSLLERLQDPRVRRVLEPVVAGQLLAYPTIDDDLSYVRDLGLVAEGLPVRIANPIYKEVIVRVLASPADTAITAEPRSFVRADGRLDLDRLLQEFAAFWREHGAILEGRMPYPEAGAQLVMMAFLQRVVNGGGHVDREYGAGRGRIDLLLRWPHRGAGGRREEQREALELKVWRGGEKDPLPRGLQQLDEYLARTGLHRGVLVVFDRRPGLPPLEDRTRFEETTTPSGRAVTLLWA